MTNHNARKGKVDGQVLQLLQSNPSLTQQQIAERLEVARGKVGSAITRLKETGQIVGSGFILDSQQDTSFKIRECYGFVLISNPYKPEDKKPLETMLKQSYAVGVTHMITGGKFSYLFSFYVAHNSTEFLNFIEPVRDVAHTETHLTVTCF